MKKLRLILWEDCDRQCAGCCNKDWDVGNLPVCDDFSDYDLIMLTGGEPMLYPVLLHSIIRAIRRTSDALVYVYTADVRDIYVARTVVGASDGMVVTLHEQGDFQPFWNFAKSVDFMHDRSLRVNAFSGVTLPETPQGWKVKRDIEWIPNCPLPEGETLMRLPKLR